MSTSNTIRISPDSKTYATAQLSPSPLAYALATHAGSGILRRDKSLQWQDAIQCAALALLESGHNPCQKIPLDGQIRIPAGLVSAIRKSLQAMASPVNGLTRGHDKAESTERKKSRDRISAMAKRLKANPMSMASKAIDLGLFPKANAFDIYRRLEDIKTLNGNDWRKAIAYATPKISAKGIASLAESRGTNPIKSVIYGRDSRCSSPAITQRYGF